MEYEWTNRRRQAGVSAHGRTAKSPPQYRTAYGPAESVQSYDRSVTIRSSSIYCTVDLPTAAVSCDRGRRLAPSSSSNTPGEEAAEQSRLESISHRLLPPIDVTTRRRSVHARRTHQNPQHETRRTTALSCCCGRDARLQDIWARKRTGRTEVSAYAIQFVRRPNDGCERAHRQDLSFVGFEPRQTFGSKMPTSARSSAPAGDGVVPILRFCVGGHRVGSSTDSPLARARKEIEATDLGKTVVKPPREVLALPSASQRSSRRSRRRRRFHLIADVALALSGCERCSRTNRGPMAVSAARAHAPCCESGLA